MDESRAEPPPAPSIVAYGRRDLTHRVILLLVVLALWATRRAGPLDLRFDAGVYYVTGVALAEGRGYRLLNEPGAAAAVQYPPLLPAVVAATIRITGTSDPDIVATRLRFVWFVLTLVHSQLVYALARRWLGPGGAFVASVVALLAFQTYRLSEMLFAELPFAVLLGAFLLARHRLSRGRATWVQALLAGALFLLRAQGVAALAAWVGESLRERAWRSAALRALLAVIPFAGWSLFVRAVTTSAEYQAPAYEYQRAAYQYHNVPYATNARLVDPFTPELGTETTAGLVGRVLRNVLELPRRLGETVSVAEDIYADLCLRVARPHLTLAAARTLAAWLSGLVGALALLGLVVLVRRGAWLEGLALAASALLVCATPWPEQFARYLMPFTPLLAIALVAGLRSLSGMLLGPLRAAWGNGLAGLVILGVVGVELAALRDVYASRAAMPVSMAARSDSKAGSRPFYYGRVWRAFDGALAWLRAHSDPADVIATVEPHYAWLRTGRRAVFPPLVMDPSEARRLLDTVPVRYVVVDRLGHLDCARRYTLPTLIAQPESWDRVFVSEDGRTSVFRRRDRRD